MLIAAGVALIVALFLMAIGWRGRRIDEHLICRRCGFDLAGLPAGSRVCSECGRDLTQPGSIRIGHRRTRRGWLTAGITLLTPIVLILSTAVYITFSGANWRKAAPLWYLLHDASSADAARRAPALAELSTRLTSQRLPQPDLDRLLDVGLNYQGDVSKPWDPTWGDLIEYAQETGKLSNDRWMIYARQSIMATPVFTAPSKMHAGETSHWLFAFPGMRTASYTALESSLTVDCQWNALQPLPQAIFLTPGGGGGWTGGTVFDGDPNRNHGCIGPLNEQVSLCVPREFPTVLMEISMNASITICIPSCKSAEPLTAFFTRSSKVKILPPSTGPVMQ